MIRDENAVHRAFFRCTAKIVTQNLLNGTQLKMAVQFYWIGKFFILCG